MHLLSYFVYLHIYHNLPYKYKMYFLYKVLELTNARKLQFEYLFLQATYNDNGHETTRLLFINS